MSFKIFTPLISCWLGLLLAASTLPCVGQGVTYTSRSAFDAAIVGLAGSRRDVDFEGALPPGGIDQGGGIVLYRSALSLSGVTFQGGVLVLRDTANGRILINYDSLEPLMVEMDGPSLAFGADFSALRLAGGTPFTATVSFDNGDVFTFPAATDPSRAFFGYVTTQPFSSVTFSDGGWGVEHLHDELIDNITAVVVTEPGVFALFALGSLLLGWRFQKWRI